MSRRARRCLPRLQTCYSAQLIPSTPQRGPSHESEWHSQNPALVSTGLFVADRLRKSSVIRHSGLVLSSVATLFRRGHPSFCSHTRSLAAVRGNRLADCDVSEPDGAVRICVVAHAVSLNTEFHQ